MQGSVDIVKKIIVKDFKFLAVVRGKDAFLTFSCHLERGEGVTQILQK